MNKKYTVAVVGATGAVGETMLEILAERKFPIEKLYLLASERTAGDTLLFAKKPHLIENLAEFDFSQVDIALFSAGGTVSKEYAPKAAAKGCVVIDNTSEFRNGDDIAQSFINSYKDSLQAPGIFEYTVSAVYEDSESDKSVSFFIASSKVEFNSVLFNFARVSFDSCSAVARTVLSFFSKTDFVSKRKTFSNSVILF